MPCFIHKYVSIKVVKHVYNTTKISKRDVFSVKIKMFTFSSLYFNISVRSLPDQCEWTRGVSNQPGMQENDSGCIGVLRPLYWNGNIDSSNNMLLTKVSKVFIASL